MSKTKNKVYDWKDRLRKGKMLTLVIALISIIAVLTVFALIKSRDYRRLVENNFNQAFYELIEHTGNIEKLLAKSTISNDSKHASKILTNIYQTSALAQTYLARVPIEPQDLENTQKFLNQLSDYCFTLSEKTIRGEKLSQEDLDNLYKMHEYSIDLKNTVNQLEQDLYEGNIRWGELQKKGKTVFESEDKNLSESSFSNIEENLHQYTGLIYDGAFSENVQEFKGNGLEGEEINEEKAKEIAIKYVGNEKISSVDANGETENAKIPSFNFSVKLMNDSELILAISKKGGKLIMLDCNREVQEKSISNEDAIKKGKEYLDSKGYTGMQETYYMDEGNVLTINYAYVQTLEQETISGDKEVVVYPDLIKVKVAMDNGEVLGLEAGNYLNNHKQVRNFDEIKITKDQALELVNKKLEIKKISLTIIPTEYNTEIICYEIKGKTGENDFLVYINATTGEEEDILMIIDTPNGTLTT